MTLLASVTTVCDVDGARLAGSAAVAQPIRFCCWEERVSFSFSSFGAQTMVPAAAGVRCLMPRQPRACFRQPWPLGPTPTATPLWRVSNAYATPSGSDAPYICVGKGMTTNQAQTAATRQM